LRLGELVKRAMVAGRKPWWSTWSRTGRSCSRIPKWDSF
jgi:hypothetical protein